MPEPAPENKSLLAWALAAVGGVTGLVVIAGVVGLVAFFIYKTADPMKGTTPDAMEALSDAKSVCEGRVQRLKAKSIDGAAQYEIAQRAANSCIGYLIGVIDQGSGNKDEIKKRLDDVSAKCNDFQRWSDQQLQTGAIEGKEIDLAPSILDVVMGAVNKQEMDRRNEVKKSLEKCRLQSWSEIPAGTGALGK